MAELHDLDVNYGLRVIKTARDLKSINRALKEGYRPIVRRVVPSPEISDHYRLVRNPRTGEIIKQIDFRDGYFDAGPFEVVLDWTSYYPYTFKSPFAA